MFFPIRFDRKFIIGAVAILIAALSLTMAPAARAVNAVPKQEIHASSAQSRIS